tara:strand:- start:24 stop:788 length:765 start_codon:yes stop_codon:yes gene_type:complete
MESKRIALLIPTTSANRNWASIKDSYLYRFMIPSLLNTIDSNNSYTIYLGIDKQDNLFDNKASCRKIKELLNKSSAKITLNITKFTDIQKGHLTKMWNILFQKAYDENNDYFYQCGDDINFKTKNWVNDCINALQQKNDIGLSGPINNNPNILTQGLVSRKHMEIFGWFFPEEIINWCCDDWYNILYSPTYLMPLKIHYCSNDGGTPRYTINNNNDFSINREVFNINLINLRNQAKKIADRDKVKLNNYILGNQ